jgi:hypothetical protein
MKFIFFFENWGALGELSGTLQCYPGFLNRNVLSLDRVCPSHQNITSLYSCFSVQSHWHFFWNWNSSWIPIFLFSICFLALCQHATSFTKLFHRCVCCSLQWLLLCELTFIRFSVSKLALCTVLASSFLKGKCFIIGAMLAHFLHFSRHSTFEQTLIKLKGLSDTYGNLVLFTCP